MCLVAGVLEGAGVEFLTVLEISDDIRNRYL